MLIHTPATRPPGTQAVAREVKMDVILPKILMEERPDVGVALSRIIQYFAEHVAVPAMTRWDDANHTASWPAPAPRVALGERGTNQLVVPQGLTPRHVIYGRIPGELEDLIATLQHGAVLLAPPAIGGPAVVVLPAPPPTVPPTAPPTAPPPAVQAAPVVIAEEDDLGFVSPPNKPYIKLKHAPDDPYSAEELLAFAEAHYDSDGEPKGKGKGKARDRGHLDHVSVAAAVPALQNRIMELEDINAAKEADRIQLVEVVANLSERVAELDDVRETQQAEILGLRAALRNALSGTYIIIHGTYPC